MNTNMKVGVSFNGNLTMTRAMSRSKGQVHKLTTKHTTIGAIDQTLIEGANKLVGKDVKNVAVTATDANVLLANIGLHPKYQGKILISNTSTPLKTTIQIKPANTRKIGSTSYKFVI